MVQAIPKRSCGSRRSNTKRPTRSRAGACCIRCSGCDAKRSVRSAPSGANESCGRRLERSPRWSGESALFSIFGHKGDLLTLHFRRSFDELERAQADIAALELSAFLEQTGSYVSMVEIGMYEGTVALNARLVGEGLRPHSPEWKRAIEEELVAQRDKMAPRLWPKIPTRRYLCFYPMNKRRAGADNWYQLPIDERRRLMHEHGMIGRRFAGQVTQIISGSVGFDDWEWGVDLFADDPLVFKKLVYEMRFDESSARYAKFGSFYVGIRLKPDELPNLLAVPGEG